MVRLIVVYRSNKIHVGRRYTIRMEQGLRVNFDLCQVQRSIHGHYGGVGYSTEFL